MSKRSHKQVNFAVETVTASDGRQDFRLWIDGRVGRGLIVEPTISLVAGKAGFMMRFFAQDGVPEAIGSNEAPIPIEALKAAKTPRGITLVSVREINGKTEVMNPAQVLNIDPKSSI